jgi:hypothetical protein
MKITKKIKEYKIEILVLIGSWLVLGPRLFHYSKPNICLNINGSSCSGRYITDWDKIGWLLIIIAILVLIRKYIIKNK